jgi:hypothetical protein
MSWLSEVLGLQAAINWDDVLKLVLRFGLNIGFATIVIKATYSRLYRNRTYEFTYYAFNIVTFCLCILMRKVPAELGFALAIFAVFGVLRYRTQQIRIRDLTYMFLVIGIAILNAIAYKNVSLPELLFVNICIAGFTVLYERGPSLRHESSLRMVYDRVDLLKTEKRAELHSDIEQRTGVKAKRVEVLRMDLLRDAANIVVFYTGQPPGGHTGA